jgi:hypothetical protein
MAVANIGDHKAHALATRLQAISDHVDVSTVTGSMGGTSQVRLRSIATGSSDRPGQATSPTAHVPESCDRPRGAALRHRPAPHQRTAHSILPVLPSPAPRGSHSPGACRSMRGTSRVYRRSITPGHRVPLAKRANQTPGHQVRAIRHDLQRRPGAPVTLPIRSHASSGYYGLCPRS